MAADNVTPIYGEWLVRHIDYYIFRGEKAYALKKELMSLDVNSSASDGALVDCYRRFVYLFVNNVYDTAFEQAEQGIMAVNNKGFLVNNQYNVWTPIGLMEENGKKGEIDLDFGNSVTSRKIGEKAAELTEFIAKSQEELNGLRNWPDKSKPSRIAAYGMLVLCILVIVSFFVNWSTIPVTDFHFPMVILWGGIALILLVGVIKTVKQFEALHRWKRLKELLNWFGNFLAQGNKDLSILVEYKTRLADELAHDNSMFTIPRPSQSLKSYFSFLDGKARALQDIVKKSGKLRKKTGKIMPVLLAAVLVFVAYGQGHWGMVDALRHIASGGEKETDGNKPASTEESPAKPVLVGKNPVSVTDAVASSELTVNKYTYFVTYSYDGDINTSWQEGSPENGVGEVLTYYFDQPRCIVGVDIINGRVDIEKNYYDNNRIERLVVYYLLDGLVKGNAVVDLADVYNMEPVYYELTDGIFDEAYYCDSIQVEIESVYEGVKFNDLCLTEILFYEGIYE